MALKLVEERGRGAGYAPDSDTVLDCAKLILSDKTGQAARYFLNEITERYTKLGLASEKPVHEVLNNLTRMTENIEKAYAANGCIWGSQPAPTMEEVNYTRNLEQLAKAGADAIGDRKQINVEFNFAINEATKLLRGYALGQVATETDEARIGGPAAEEGTHGRSTR